MAGVTNGFTATAMWAKWLSVPLVAVACTEEIPAALEGGTSMTNDWLAPSATVKGLTGWVVAPAGKPESVTDTEPVNPFRPTTEIEMFDVEFPEMTLS